MIELKNVTKNYETGKTFVEALKGVSFTFKKSDFVLIRGPSGSGKSTLLNIVGLLDNPTDGEVYLNGQKVSYADFDELATVIADASALIYSEYGK